MPKKKFKVKVGKKGNVTVRSAAGKKRTVTVKVKNRPELAQLGGRPL